MTPQNKKSFEFKKTKLGSITNRNNKVPASKTFSRPGKPSIGKATDRPGIRATSQSAYVDNLVPQKMKTDNGSKKNRVDLNRIDSSEFNEDMGEHFEGAASPELHSSPK